MKNKTIKNTEQVSNFISEGNPLDQNVTSDQQTVREIKQAINDDQGLTAVAKDIQVTANNGTVTLEGEVKTKQEMNLANNTAGALAVDEKVKNNIVVTPHQ